MTAVYRSSGHQTFAFRYGWLEKGVRGVSEDPCLFSREDALVRLGVGKNMVDSIRYWCQLSQLVEPVPASRKTGPQEARPTQVAERLLLEPGWDPFLEDDASLWLIHWKIVTNPGIRTAWQLLFSRFGRPDFTRAEITSYIRDFTDRMGIAVRDSVLARDVDCLIRTYVPGAGNKKLAVAEETFSCPLIQLNLIHPLVDGDLYRFSIGAKPSLPSAVFFFALTEFFDRRESHAETMSIQDCLYGEGSPGQAFRLDENSIIEYLEDLEESLRGSMILDETAGLKQIYRRERLDPLKVLGRYYRGDSWS